MRTGYAERFNSLAVGDVIYTPETKEERKLTGSIFSMVAAKHVCIDLEVVRPYIKTGLNDILIGESGKHITFDSEKEPYIMGVPGYKKMKVLLSILELIEESDRVKFKFNGADEFSLSVKSKLGAIVFETYSELHKYEDERRENRCMRNVNAFSAFDEEEEDSEENGYYNKGFKVYIADDIR